MRRVAILGVLMALGMIAKAQTGNTVIRTFAGAPTGSCSSVMVAVNGSSGNFFDCLSGAWHNVASGGSGTVTSFSAGNLSPLFTTSVATSTTTPALTFSASTFAPHTFYGNNTAGTATPGAQAIGNADLPGSGSITLNAASPLGGGGSIALGGTLNFTCTGCLTSVTAHNLLSATHGDTTAGTVARGDVVTGQGASPTWTRLAKGAASQCLQMDGSAVDVLWGPCAAGGAGTVTSFSSGNLSPLFTTSVATATTTPALTFALSNAAAHTFFMNNTAGSAAPGFQSPSKSDLLATTVYTDQSNTYSAATSQNMDTVTAKYWGGAPVFDVSKFAGVDWCAKVLAVYSDAAFIAASKAVLDARGLTGTQTCAAGSTTLSATKPVHWILGQMTLSLPNSGVSFLDINGVQTSLAAPAAPTLATATTGGSLAAATTYGVKVSYSNLTGETLPSSETTKLTGAGATNSITVTSPANSTSLQCYNVYSATPVGSGWKLNNTTGCIPLGTNYVIQTVGAGAIPLATGTAWEGMLEFEGQGDSTIISEDSVNSPFLISNNNVYIHNLKFVSSQTSNNNGSLWIDSSKDVVADRITCAGGGNCVFINASNRITASNIHYGNPTVSGSAVASASSSNVRAINVTMNNSVMPAGGNLQGAVSFNACTDCSINGVIARSNDMSLITNAAAVIVQGASLRTNIHDVNCDGLINSDCVAILNFSLDTNISNVNCANTAVGTGAGIGTNTNNGDCIDLFSAGRVNITNTICQSMGLIGGLRFPCNEFFDSSEISATNISAYDSSGEGAKLFGCTGCSITNSHFNRNGKSGILLVDSATVVTCNNTTTVAYVSGNGFGPWPAGTTVNIGAGPTAFQIASVASTTSMTLTTTCNLGASQAFTVFTQDTQLNDDQTDDNGTGLQGANTQSGIDVLGSSQASITGGSANDNRATASKTQMFGINVGSTTAGVSAVNFDPSSNLGGTCTNEIGPATAGNHWICDLGKKSTLLLRNGATPTWLIAPASTNGASLNVPTGVAPTSPANGDLWNDGTNYNIRLGAVTYAVGRIVGSGTAAMTTAAIAGGACGTTVTVAATNVATTDTITIARNAAATAANGGILVLNAWPTSGNVNFNYCNGGTLSNTPTAMTLNWRVVR